MISHGSLTYTFTKLKSTFSYSEWMVFSKSRKSWQSRSSSQRWKAYCLRGSLPWRCVCQWKAANVWMVLLATCMLLRATPLGKGLAFCGFLSQTQSHLVTNETPEEGLNCTKYDAVYTNIYITSRIECYSISPACGTSTNSTFYGGFQYDFFFNHWWYIS